MTIEVLEIQSSIRATYTMTNMANTGIRKTAVKQSLFGPVDAFESMKFIEKELKSIADLSSSKWNFNFQTGEPINDPDAKYKWTKISKEESVPLVYASSRYPYACQKSQSTPANDTNISTTVPVATFAPIHEAVAAVVVETQSTTKTTQSLPHSANKFFQNEVESRLSDGEKQVSRSTSSPLLVQTSIRDYTKLRKQYDSVISRQKKSTMKMMENRHRLRINLVTKIILQ